MNGRLMFFSFCFFLCLTYLGSSTAVFAESIDCNLCHTDLSDKKNVHAAVQMGCTTCHVGLDAGNVPHTITNNVSKGLSSPQPEICYGCHDQDLFSGKSVVHVPVVSGMCTGCHNPHSSVNEKLLMADLPELCYSCHDHERLTGTVMHKPAQVGLCITCHNPHQANRKALLIQEMPDLCFQCHDEEPFTKKNVHPPVADNLCIYCHNPHASQHDYMLSKKPVELCLDCHPSLAKEPHVLAKRGHPIGLDQKKIKRSKKSPKKNTKKKEKEFYCGNCHDPHSSNWKNLFKFEANSIFELCIHCHQK